MSDDETIAAVRAILDAGPSDRRVTSMRVVPGADGFDDLELTFAIDGETVVSRVLFDRTWRAESGLTDPRAYATFVEARWQAGLTGERPDPDRGTPGQDELWHVFERALRVDAAGVNRVGHGAWEVVESDGDPVTIHVTPQQWRRLAAGREQEALEQLDDVIGSRWDDEEHVVYFRGEFHPSVRAELPPLRSRLSPE